jgi:citrate lyase subunit beta/citryl-CoA lyase
MLARSYLYAPGNRPDLLGKVLQQGADAVILDLEDAVPATEKQAARRMVAEFIASLPVEGSRSVFVRLNAGEAALEDASALPLARLGGLRLPKAERPAVVAALDRLIGDTPGVEIHPIIESVAGLFELDELARASSRVRRVAFGAGDFVRDIRGDQSIDREETFLARAQLVLRSRFLGLEPPIAHVYTPIRDLAGLERACRADRALGFFGRSCIHPSQVATINAAFTYGPEERSRAERIVDAYRAAAERGRGAFTLEDGTFVDEAVMRRAARILSLIGARP